MNNNYPISPLDGRYNEKVKELSAYFSEFAYFKYRIKVELKYLIFLCREKIVSQTIKSDDEKKLNDIWENFSQKDFEKIKYYEDTTNHDVKAMEYYVRDKLGGTLLSPLSAFVHLGLTSEDVNNLSYGSMVRDFLADKYCHKMKEVIFEIKNKAGEFSSSVMIGRTHGQAAVPTTLGKEMAVFASRLEKILSKTEKVQIFGKLNGAVGNYNSLVFTYPHIDWQEKSKKFVQSLGLEWNSLTTQIEPGDNLVETFNYLKLFNRVLLGFCQDIWLYQSFGYLATKPVKEEVGSSTMPQKVNPIDFENAEGNLEVANSLFNLFSETIPISRLQRDLSDSTVKRNIGVAFGHSIVAISSLIKGLKKVIVNEKKMLSDLDNDWSVLSEAVQVLLRANGVERSYELVKDLTRGEKIGKNEYLKLINKLNISNNLKNKLKNLTPVKYIGLAKELCP